MYIITTTMQVGKKKTSSNFEFMIKFSKCSGDNP